MIRSTLFGIYIHACKVMMTFRKVIRSVITRNLDKITLLEADVITIFISNTWIYYTYVCTMVSQV